MMTPRALTLTPLLVSLAATLALVACNRAEEPRTAGQVLDQSVEQVEQKAKEVSAEVRAGSEKAITTATDAGTKSSAVVATAARDAAITLEIKALLAKDPDLSALRIDVDTAGGRVVLHGAAPTATARERATQLATAVSGVTNVDNQLALTAPR